MSDYIPQTVTNEPQTVREEFASALTHAIGAGLAVVGLLILIAVGLRTGDPYRLVAGVVYGLSLVALYLASTLFHTFQTPKLKRTFLIADHIGIFLLIAGTYTPVLLIKMRDTTGSILLLVIWAIAIVGSCLKAFFSSRFNILTVSLYLMLGWMVILIFGPISEGLGRGGTLLLIAGGLCYTLGVIPYLMHRLPYNHAIWHLFVMAGSACHFLSILYFVMLA